MKKVVAFLMSAVMLFSISSVSFASESNENLLSSEDKAKISRFADDLGLSNEVKETLIKKIESGELPDSDNPEKKDTGVTYEFVNSENLKIKRTVFPDGSVIQSVLDTTDANEQIVTPMIVDNSTGWVESGSGYKKYYNATVKEETVMVKAKFFADYVLVNGGYPYISKVFDGYVEAAGGYVNNETPPTIDNQSQTSTAPAKATYSFTFVKINGSFSSTYKLHLYIFNTTASSQLDTY
ncbi:hypothetical protein ACFRAM_08250 [Paenibacillus sp. NPDC056722]|uniref:hypothetical protein n=1 Tax=Paenibacillus sp. NPDC056722 TaxID=3345924 RepID=UPI0036A40D8E